MKLTWAIAATLLALCAVLVVMLSVDLGAPQGGEKHERYATLQKGTSASPATMLVGAVFGTLQIILFVSCLALGMRKKERLGERAWWFVSGGVIYALVFAAILVSYREYASSETTSLALSLPLPTALVLYGLWPAPLLFLVLYFATFHRWVLTREDIEQFRQLVERTKQRREQERND